MTDIVWSLRNDVPCNGDIGCAQELCEKAAAEIERLRAALEIAANDLNDWGAYTKANNARAALVGDK
jgi:hypothetical protein